MFLLLEDRATGKKTVLNGEAILKLAILNENIDILKYKVTKLEPTKALEVLYGVRDEEDIRKD